MFLPRLFCKFLLGVCSILMAHIAGFATACAQMPEERPLTPQEAQEELVSLLKDYKNTSVHLVPGATLRVNSSIVVTIRSAKVVRERLLVTGTIRNVGPKVMQDVMVDLDLLESFEFQVARYQKEPVRVWACGGPCVNSYNKMYHGVFKSLLPGQSVDFSASKGNFSRTFINAKASDMILIM